MTSYRTVDVSWGMVAVVVFLVVLGAATVAIGGSPYGLFMAVLILACGQLAVGVGVADGELRVTRNLWHVRRIALGDAVGVRRVSFETRDLEGVELALRGGAVAQVWTRDADGLLAAVVAAAPLPVGAPGRVGPERGPMTDAEYRRFFGTVGAVAAAAVALFGWAAWDVLAR